MAKPNEIKYLTAIKTQQRAKEILPFQKIPYPLYGL